jgi:hypothetical protein
MNQDEEHLRLLAIFHYVVAGLTALFSMFPLLHLALGLFVIFSPRSFQEHGNPPPAFIGWFFVVFASVFILLGLTLATFILINGRCIAKRRHYTFCQVIACVECLLMPFGTILGVFTLIVLSRESVKPLFGIRSAAPR